MTDREKEIEKMANAIEEGCKEKKKKHRCNVVGCDECMAEFLVGLGYRKADDLIAEIAGLTGKVEALQKDNENLMSTIEEGREGEKPKTRENEFYEPIWEEINEKHVVVEQYWKVKCPCCGDTLCGSSFKDRLEEDIPNYCPQCGALLKEVKDETPKD